MKGGRGEKHLAFEGKRGVCVCVCVHGVTRADWRVGRPGIGLEKGRGGGLIKGPIQGGLHFNSELTFPLLHLGSPFMGLPLGRARCFNARRLLLCAHTYTGR